MPTYRPRRLRASEVIRDLVAETSINPAKLIMPHFVCEGSGYRKSIDSMPGIENVSIDNLLRDIEADCGLGINMALFFGIPAEKDDVGTGAYAEDGIVQKALREVKKRFPQLCLITDVCLCEYTSHGHCGIVKDGKVLNDPTLDLLSRTALSHTRAGADIVAPSDMMDGRVGAIREALDDNGFSDTPIMAYSAKVRLCLLRPIPRRGRQRAPVRRPQGLPDGSPQRPRSRARGGPGPGGGSGHRHGEAGPFIP